MRNFTYLLFSLIFITACSDDNEVLPNPFVAAFDLQSSNMGESKTISISFSETTTTSGYIKIQAENLTSDNVQTEYGRDYTTSPEPENGYILLPFSANASGVSFEFESLITEFNAEDQTKGVKFNISEIDYRDGTSIQGYSTHLVSFDVKLGGTEHPQIGGPNEENQVYFDLSTGTYKLVQRDSWDLGFYSGESFRVVLNGSIYMAAKNLESYDIDAITSNEIPDSYFNDVRIGTFDAENVVYIDNPNGDLTGTAIQEIQVEPNENQVYLINLGYTVGNTTPNNGSVAIAGESRGWKKIRILRQNGGYLLQYANLDDTTHSELYIPKLPEYNFNHFSFDTEDLITVQPPKNEWDLCFTVFTNIVTDNNGNSAGSYGFSDFVVNNILGDAKAFMIIEENGYTYENYNLNEALALTMLSEDQRAIGSNWRSVFEGIYTDRFFVINDTDGNWYKIKFLALTDENGERGHPKFEYQILSIDNSNTTIKHKDYLNIKI